MLGCHSKSLGSWSRWRFFSGKKLKVRGWVVEPATCITHVIKTVKLESTLWGKAFFEYRETSLQDGGIKFFKNSMFLSYTKSTLLVSESIHTSSTQQRLGKLTLVGLWDNVNLVCSFASVPSVNYLKSCSNLLELKKFGELSGRMPSGARNWKALSLSWVCSKSVFLGRMLKKSWNFVTKLPGWSCQ